MRAPAGRAALLLVTLFACGDETHPRLPDVPSGVDQFDPAVQDQLRSAHRAATDALADEDRAPEQRANAVGHLGRVYQAYRRYPAAVATYEIATWLAPEEPTWYYLLSVAKGRQGDFEGAERAARQAVEAIPDDPHARLQLSRFLQALGRNDEADKEAAEALRLEPTLARAWTLRGQLALASGDAVTALELLKEARIYAPRATEISYAMAMAHTVLGDREAAGREIADITTEFGMRDGFPADPRLREISSLKLDAANLARDARRAAARSGQVALVQSEQALSADPDRVHLHLSRAWILTQQGKLDEALAETALLLAADPLYEPGIRLQAEIHRQAARWDEALQSAERAVGLSPISEDSQVLLGEILSELDRCDEATEHFDAAIRYDPGLVAAHVGRASCLRRLGDPERACAALALAAEALPEEAELSAAMSPCPSIEP